MQIKHLLLIIIVMIFIGSAYPLGKLGTNYISPVLFSAMRVLFIFIGILPFFRFKIYSKKIFLPLIAFSLTMGVGVYLTLYLALDISSLVSPIIIGTQLTVPFGLILSYIFLNEKISIRKWFLIFFAFLGIIVLSYDPRLSSEWVSLLIISLMAFFYALSNMLSRFLQKVDSISQIGWHSLIGCIVLFILSFIIEGNPVNSILEMPLITLIFILHASIFVSLLGHGIVFYLYKFYPVATVLPFYSLFPIFGILFTFMIFYELPSLFEYVGGSIVIISVYLIHLDNKKNK